MTESLEDLERRLPKLRLAARAAAQANDRDALTRAREELRATLARWEELLAREVAAIPTPNPPRPEVPVRERVHAALTLLTAPAAPKLVAEVHAALGEGSALPETTLRSLRKDEARSFRAQPYARGWYIVPALDADTLTPVPGLLAVSTWPLVDRIVIPEFRPVHHLRHAAGIARHLATAAERGQQPTLPARRLLRKLAASIPGATTSTTDLDPAKVTRATRAETARQAEDVVQLEARLAANEAARKADLSGPELLFGAGWGADG